MNLVNIISGASHNIEVQIKTMRKKKRRPRHAVLLWMRRNPLWYQEAIAQEWERQTGEDWLAMIEKARLA